MLVCSYCNQEKKNANSHRNHERLCSKNPNRQFTQISSRILKKEHVSNQFIKAKKLGLPSPEISVETRQAISESNLRRTAEWNVENGKRISASIKEKVKNGEWHTSLAKKIHFNYKGEDLHGSWELKYAMHLDSNGVEWVRNKESFEYVFEGISRRYTPDFYLPGTQEYIEIKGYKTLKDEAKWSFFPSDKKLVVLMELDLEEMGVL